MNTLAIKSHCFQGRKNKSPSAANFIGMVKTNYRREQCFFERQHLMTVTRQRDFAVLPRGTREQTLRLFVLGNVWEELLARKGSGRLDSSYHSTDPYVALRVASITLPARIGSSPHGLLEANTEQFLPHVLLTKVTMIAAQISRSLHHREYWKTVDSLNHMYLQVS